MADSVFDLSLPPEISASAEAIARRRKLAEAMLQQSGQSPSGQMIGKIYVAPHPLQLLAQAVRGLGAQRNIQLADDERKALGTKYQSGVADAMLNYQRTKAGEPGRAPELDPQELEQQADLGSPAPPNVGAVAGDPKAAITAALMNPYLAKNPLVAADAAALKPQVLGRSLVEPATGKILATDSTWQAEQDANRQARLDAIEAQAREGRITREEADRRAAAERAEARRQATADREHLLRVAANLRPAPAAPAAPAITPVTIADPNNPNETIVIDGRTRSVLGRGPKQTEAGKLNTKREFNMQGFGDITAEAERILNDPARKPTGSGAGALWDRAAGFVGITPAGAAEAQELKAIGAALVAKMPRMEGPQSDKDVLLYRESAAQIGDPTVPVEARVRALSKVKELYGKYERRAPGSPDGRTSPGLPSASDIDAELARRRGGRP